MGLALLTQACSLVRSTPPAVVGGRQEGIASWYGPGFHGRRTANGEIYDQYELTAAHQTLPLGTRVMVTSLTNGRVVEVRINDRGPFVGGRVLDLSYAAARVLGMIGPGTMPVRIEVVDDRVQVASRQPIVPTPPPPAREPAPRPIPHEPEPPSVREPARVAAPPSDTPRVAYAIVVATLSDAGRAEHLRSRIAIRFPDASVSAIDVGTDRYYRVGIGPYPSRSEAVARGELVNRYGYPAVITEAAR